MLTYADVHQYPHVCASFPEPQSQTAMWCAGMNSGRRGSFNAGAGGLNGGGGLNSGAGGRRGSVLSISGCVCCKAASVSASVSASACDVCVSVCVCVL